MWILCAPVVSLRKVEGEPRTCHDTNGLRRPGHNIVVQRRQRFCSSKLKERKARVMDDLLRDGGGESETEEITFCTLILSIDVDIGNMALLFKEM